MKSKLTVPELVRPGWPEALPGQLAAIVESSDDAIIGTTQDGTIVSWNTGAERLYGYSAVQLKGFSISILVPPERSGEAPGILEKIKNGERLAYYETVRVRQCGTRIDVSETISPVRDAGGNLVGASTIARDITEHKRTEEARVEVERMRVLTQTAAGAAERVFQPLTVIIGHAEILLTKTSSDDPRRSHLETILREAWRISEIVKKMEAPRRYVTRPLMPGLDVVDFDAAATTDVEAGDAGEGYGLARPGEGKGEAFETEHPVRLIPDKRNGRPWLQSALLTTPKKRKTRSGVLTRRSGGNPC